MTDPLGGERWAVRCGDAVEMLRDLPEGCVDAVVTDPPYGIGFDRGTWDDDPEKYPDLIRAFVAEANRVVAGGPVFVWQALPNWRHWHEWFPEEARVFAACKGFVQFRPTPVQWSWDPVLFWGDCPCPPTFNSRDWHLQTLAPAGPGRVRVDHPCPKPLEQVEYVVALATQPGDLVLDCFSGSGTTGVACLLNGRRFLGFDIDPHWCEVARERLRWAARGLREPRPVKAPEGQLSMECE